MKTVKVALFHNNKYNFDSVAEITLDGGEEYTRTSEIVEVQFPDRSRDEIVVERVKALDNVLAQLQDQIQRVLGEKQELLALTSGE